LEVLLLEYDSNFEPSKGLYESRPFSETIIGKLSYGDQAKDNSLAMDAATQAQIHLNVERIKIPESLFQPGIFGVEQAGLSEVMNDVVKNFEDDVQFDFMKVRFFFPGVFVGYLNILLMISLSFSNFFFV